MLILADCAARTELKILMTIKWHSKQGILPNWRFLLVVMKLACQTSQFWKLCGQFI